MEITRRDLFKVSAATAIAGAISRVALAADQESEVDVDRSSMKCVLQSLALLFR
jgi:hypothetical protein